MAVVALLIDAATGTEVYFDLTLSQRGAPFLVWGTGVASLRPPASGTHLQANTYYYSLTRLEASGTVTIGSEKFAVNGVTWMDHEYGAMPAGPVKWFLQNVQLDNGWTLSNYTMFASPPGANQPVSSIATLQGPDGAMYVQKAFLTPSGRTWTSPASGTAYVMEFKLEIPAFQATLTVSSLLEDQEFRSVGFSLYEGVAVAAGTFAGKPVSGTAWNEQAP